MASSLKNLSDHDFQTTPSAEALRIGIVVSEYHQKITSALLEGCLSTLMEHGAKQENIHIAYVPGTFELPAGGIFMVEAKVLDAVICLGCVIKGETKHDEYINHAVADGLIRLSERFGIPFIYGVLTPNTAQQATDRSGGKHGNKGVEAAISAIKMAALKHQLGKSIKKSGFK